MNDWIDINKDEKHVAKERAKARELRNSNWWKQVLASGVCHYCKKKFKKNELTMDHIVSVARGGKSTKGNCVPCCKECNNEKSFLTPVELILKKMKENKNR